MSDERFEVDIDHLLLVWDTEENKRLEIEDIVDLLNELNKEFEDCGKLLDSKDDFIHKFKRDIEELGISIKLFEDDIATKDKKIDEQQDTIRKLRNENIISKNKIEDLRTSLFMLNKELERQTQRSCLDE